MAHHLIPSNATIKAVKPGDARGRLTDGAGLYLRLFVKGGSHGWRFDYSLNGRRNTLSLGTYPNTGLSLARKKADDARKLVSAGVDPSTVRKEARDVVVQQRATERRAAAGLPPEDSFEAVAREWHAKNVASWAPSHSIKMQLAEFMQRARRCATARLQGLVEFRRQLQQREVMRYRRQVHAELPGNGGIRVTAVDSLADELRHLERRQPMALLVLGDLRVAIGGQVAHDDRHFAQARSNRSAQSLGTEVDEVAAVAIRRMHDERLEDAALLDVRGEFFERHVGELGARVVRILMKQRDGDQHRPTVMNAGF